MDTSSAAITAAVSDGVQVLGSATAMGAQLHGELLAEQISASLQQAGVSAGELTDIVVGVGPGPFTGLRVGITCGAAMALALDIPVHGVCSLDAVARAAGFGDGAVVSDARRKEVYLGVYRDGRRLADPQVLSPLAAAEECAGLRVVGAGVGLYPAAFPEAGEAILPDAGQLAAVAHGAMAEGGSHGAHGLLLPPLPLYLRRPDAVESAARKRVSS